MAWAFLYVAFGIVALWLGGEVLFQYKARLRWRALAFGGFLLVVVGAVVPSIVVIVIGIAAFATGQTFVTLSHRKGFVTGWALGGGPGTSRRRRGGQRDEFEEYDPEEAAYEGAPEGDPYGAESAAEQTMVAPAYDPAEYQPDDVFTPGGYPTQTFPPADFADAPAYDQGYDQPGYEQDGYQDGYGYPQPAYDTGSYEQTAYAGAGTDPYGYADPYGGYQGDGYGAQQQPQPQPQPEPAPVYQPGPLPGETGEFVTFTGQGGQPMYGAPGGPPPQQPGYGDPYAYGGYEQQPYDPAAGYGYDQGGYDPGYGGRQPAAGDPWVPQQRADGTHPQQQPGYDHQGYYYEGY